MELREKYLKIASKVSDSIKKESNVIAVVSYGSLATDRLHAGSDIDLMVIAKKVPKNLDALGLSRKKVDGIEIDISYKTKEELVNEIDAEVGCWLVSGTIMNAIPLYDPNNVLGELKRRVVSIPKHRKKEAFKAWLEEAMIYMDKVKNTPVDNAEKSIFLMREWLGMARAMFVLNDARPSSEDSLFNEIMKLGKRPANFIVLFKKVYGLDVGRKKLEEMRKSFVELYSRLGGMKFG